MYLYEPKSSFRHYVRLVFALGLLEFKLKYKGSFLGYFWSLLNPLIFFGTLYFVFRVIFNVTAPDYALNLLLGIVMWNHFSETTAIGLESLHAKAHLIESLYFPRIVIPMATSFSTTLTFCLNIVVFIIFSLFFNLKISPAMILFPLIIVTNIVFAFGVNLIISPWYLKFRDLRHLWQMILQIGFWLTPIFYSTSIIPPAYRRLYEINPMTRIVEQARNAYILGAAPSLGALLITLGLVTVFVVLGYMVFRKTEPLFAEHIP